MPHDKAALFRNSLQYEIATGYGDGALPPCASPNRVPE